MKETEFGYPVSRDYEKLWKIIEHRYLNGDNLPIFGFAYDFDDYPNRKQIFIESNNAVEIHGIDFGCYIIISRTERVVDHNKARDRFITICKDLNLTFIDPEPTDQNAIYYADGTKVCVGDRWKFIEHGDKSIYTVKLHLGTLYAENEAGYKKWLCEFISVYWDDGNRMTNVKKVEK